MMVSLVSPVVPFTPFFCLGSGFPYTNLKKGCPYHNWGFGVLYLNTFFWLWVPTIATCTYKVYTFFPGFTPE